MESTTPMTNSSSTETTQAEKREKVINRIKEIAQNPENSSKTFKTSDLALFFNFENDNDLECFRRWLRLYFPEERRTLGRNGTDLNLQDFANFACYPKKRTKIGKSSTDEYRKTLKKEFADAGIEFIVAGKSSDDIPIERLGNANDELKEKYEKHKEKWIFVDEKYLPLMKDLDKPAENLKAKSSEESSLHMNLQVQQLAQLLEAKRKKIHLEQKIKEAREELEKTENEIKTLVAALNAVGINADNWDLGSK